MQSRTPNIRVPRLGKNRFGVFFVRSSLIDGSGRRKVTQRSLGTKDPSIAKFLALRFCLSLMSEDLVSDSRKNTQNYELDVSKGIASADGPEDHARMMEALTGLQALESQKAQSTLEMVKTMGADYAMQMMFERNLPPRVPSTTQPSSQVVAPTDAQMLTSGTSALASPPGIRTTLGEALKDHLDEEKRRLQSSRTFAEKRSLYAEFEKFFGANHLLNDITTSVITDTWRKAEQTRPSQKVSKAKMAKAIEDAQRNDEQVGVITLSFNRLEKRRAYLSVFFDWAKRGARYFHAENPMSHAVASKKDIRAHTEHFEDFKPADLTALFGQSFREEMNKPDWYWIPLISLYSGARLMELASLEVDAFDTVDGIKCYDIRKAKTEHSIRRVPIHSKLLSLGLWEYVEHLRGQGERQLFWFRPQKALSKSAGEMWGKWVERCGIHDPGKVFHSFRSTAITAMHNRVGFATNPAAIRSAVGHAGGLGDVHGRYLRGSNLQLVQEAIESLSFPEVEISSLKLEDPAFTAFFKDTKARLASPKHQASVERKKRHEAVRADREARLQKARKRTS